MGLKISAMTNAYFLRGGAMGQNEELEISANIGDTTSPATYAAKSQDIAGLAAPFRFIINETDTLSSNDDTDAVVIIARIPMTEVVREMIRYGEEQEYDPTNEFDLPTFNTFNGGTLRFNLLCKIMQNGSTFAFNSVNIACDVAGDGTNWYISGINSKGVTQTGQTLPLPYPGTDNNELWPSNIELDTFNGIQYVVVTARVNLGERDSLTINTFGSIDGVFYLENLA